MHIGKKILITGLWDISEMSMQMAQETWFIEVG